MSIMNVEPADINSNGIEKSFILRSIQFPLILLAILFIGHAHGQILENHQWKNRVLIIKTIDASTKTYVRQHQEFQDTAEQMKERKLIIYNIVKNEYTLTDYQNAAINHSGTISRQVGKKLNDDETFEILLIGLDGQIKLRQNKVLSKADLFAIIDAMPMRKSEIRN